MFIKANTIVEVHNAVTLCFFYLKDYASKTDQFTPGYLRDMMVTELDTCKAEIRDAPKAEEITEELNGIRQKIAELHYTKWSILLDRYIEAARDRITELLTNHNTI